MNTAALQSAYPAHALVAMAREANRALVYFLQVGLTHAAVDAVKRRTRYMAAARAAESEVIPTPLAVNNHDLVAAAGRARAIEVSTRRANGWLLLVIEVTDAAGHRQTFEHPVSVI